MKKEDLFPKLSKTFKECKNSKEKQSEREREGGRERERERKSERARERERCTIIIRSRKSALVPVAVGSGTEVSGCVQ